MKLALLICKEIAGVPDEFLLLQEGRIDIEGMSPVDMNESAARAVIASMERRGHDLVIDYEHQTLTDGEAPAAGWIKKLAWKAGEGLRASVEWTARAREYLQAREYRYFSPVLLVSKTTGRLLGIYNVALTNSPRVNNLQPIVARLNIDMAQDNTTGKERQMITKLRTLFKLGAEATEDQVFEAAAAIVTKLSAAEAAGQVVACKEVLTALGAPEAAGRDEVLRIVASLKAPGDVAVQLSQQVAALTSQIAEMRQADLVAISLKDGKTSPDELDKWGRSLALKDPEQFKLIVLSRPAGSIIPIGGLGGAPKDGGGPGLDDAQRAINAMCGVDDEAFKKYQK